MKGKEHYQEKNIAGVETKTRRGSPVGSRPFPMQSNTGSSIIAVTFEPMQFLNPSGLKVSSSYAT